MDLLKAGTALLQLDTAYIRRGMKRRLRLKSRWMARTFPDGMHYRDETTRFNLLYLLPDPWTMLCERERFRFRETNRVILENFGQCHNLLEIGCGEGVQSTELQRVCDHIHGIDISKRAIARAKHRCPLAHFTVGDMYSLPKAWSSAQFDLVTACEVLFYLSDIPGALSRMSQLGRACLVSYYHGPRAGLDKHVREIPGVRSEVISYEDVSWTIAWWRP